MAKHTKISWPKLLAMPGKAYPQSPNPASGLTIIKAGDEALKKLKCCYYEVICLKMEILVLFVGF